MIIWLVISNYNLSYNYLESSNYQLKVDVNVFYFQLFMVAELCTVFWVIHGMFRYADAEQDKRVSFHNVSENSVPFVSYFLLYYTQLNFLHIEANRWYWSWSYVTLVSYLPINCIIAERGQNSLKVEKQSKGVFTLWQLSIACSTSIPKIAWL